MFLYISCSSFAANSSQPWPCTHSTAQIRTCELHVRVYAHVQTPPQTPHRCITRTHTLMCTYRHTLAVLLAHGDLAARLRQAPPVLLVSPPPAGALAGHRRWGHCHRQRWGQGSHNPPQATIPPPTFHASPSEPPSQTSININRSP